MNKRDHWVSFRSTLGDPRGAHPQGLEVTTRLHQRLVEAGVDCSAVENWRDSGFSIDCQLDNRTVYCFVSQQQVPDSWMACCTSDRGILARLFGRPGGPEQTRQLAEAIHECLRLDDSFGDIRWYPDGWNGSGTETWAPSPLSNSVRSAMVGDRRMRTLRRLLGIRTAIDEAQALDQARKWARSRQLPFDPPYRISAGLKSYRVISRADGIGGNVVVTIDCRDGCVIATAGPIPR